MLLEWNKSFTGLDQEGCRGWSKIVTGPELEIFRAETKELQGRSKSVAEMGQYRVARAVTRELQAGARGLQGCSKGVRGLKQDCYWAGVRV